jgi:hypothetical protein
MKTTKLLHQLVLIAAVLFGLNATSIAQTVEGLQMAELTKKLQLNEQQQKALTPVVAQRDKQIKALRADNSLGKLQKLRRAQQIQNNFRDQAAKVLTPDQVKKLEALQAERREKVMGS